eukprot:RCo027174
MSSEPSPLTRLQELTGVPQGEAEQLLAQSSGSLDSALEAFYGRVEVPSAVLYLTPEDPLVVLLSGKRGSGVQALGTALKELVDTASGEEKVFLTSFEHTLKREFCLSRGIDFEKFLVNPELRKGYRDRLFAYFVTSRPSLESICKATIAEAQQRQSSVVVITDFRHWAEVPAVQAIAPKVLRVRVDSAEAVRGSRGWVPDPKIDTHTTETALDDWKEWDAVFSEQENKRYRVLQFLRDKFFPLVLLTLTNQTEKW